MLVLTAAATSACGAGPAPVTTDAPTPFAAAGASAPDGFTAAECPAIVGGEPVTLRLAVPTGFAAESVDPADRTPDGRCTWRSPEDHFFSVQVGADESLADQEEELRMFEDSGGDDDVQDISYDAPTEVFGGLEGERLSWWSYSDGTPTDCVYVQANGIRLYWTNPDDVDQRLDDLETVLDSVELVGS